MNVECPVCHEEIDVRVTSFDRGSWFQPPDFDYEFIEEHECQANWDNDTQEIFDNMVYDRFIEDRYSGNDY